MSLTKSNQIELVQLVAETKILTKNRLIFSIHKSRIVAVTCPATYCSELSPDQYIQSDLPPRSARVAATCRLVSTDLYSYVLSNTTNNF